MKKTKSAVQDLLQDLNELLEQPNAQCKREFRGDYNQTYGGWLFYYFDEQSKGKLIQYTRMSNVEAFRFLQGLLCSFYIKPKKESITSLQVRYDFLVNMIDEEQLEEFTKFCESQKI